MKAFAVAAAVALFALAGPAGAQSIRCAPGYHIGRHGNCQPNIPQEDRFCPRGTSYHAEPWGWNCDPAPRGYY